MSIHSQHGFQLKIPDGSLLMRIKQNKGKIYLQGRKIYTRAPPIGASHLFLNNYILSINSLQLN